ncbi:hypothetical protein NIES4073_44260 [Kalymmatonema gypsitolerans NIES-4073]|nr:hypothetical protein NIES4073_44260 [Scytonema sp. NIES-4073]
MEIATVKAPRWFVRRDIDGLFGLFLDNLIQILLIVNLCQGVLGFPPSLVYGRILPGIALSLIVGNFYSASRLRAIHKCRDYTVRSLHYSFCCM